jgi:hypothetical protein
LDARNPLSHHQTTNNGQQAIFHNHVLVPVYVLPENLNAVQRFDLSLGQPIFPAPESDYHPFLHPQNPDSSSEIDLSDESSDSVELVSLFPLLSTSTTLSISTPGASSRNRAPAVPTAFSPQVSPVPSASACTSIRKYYVVLVGKKTGVFWEEW